MSSKNTISRRTVLRGLGTAVALPVLDAMPLSNAAAAAVNPSSNAPLRMGFVFVPNGVNVQQWFPKETGSKFEFSPTLKSLEKLKDHVTVLSGLAHDKAKANGDGAGDHARSSATFLTGMQARKTAGRDIEVGISADQFAAQQIGENTRFASLELGCERGRLAGNCDSGYSCAYSGAISWRTASTPVAKETNPRLVFERLFGDGSKREAAEATARKQRHQKSILDFVQEDAKALNQKLGRRDQLKIGEYLDAVREIEKRIEMAEGSKPKQVLPKAKAPAGVPSDYGEHIRLMGDMMILAFQTDLTRISTFMIANEGSNRSYNEVGVRSGHHSLSHHGNNKKKLDDIAAINKFHMDQFAYMLNKMKSIKERGGTMLDNTMLVYGSSIADGQRHRHVDLPFVLAGKGGGTIKGGQHLHIGEQPACNLFLSLFDRMGVKADRFGDSTGRLKGFA